MKLRPKLSLNLVSMLVPRTLLNKLQSRHDQVKDDETGMACSMHGGYEECILGFGGKPRRKLTIKKT
jgi:hypothetical protein